MLKSTQLKKIVQNLPKYSYTRFVLENPVRNKIERQKAIKRFLDYSQGTPKNSK